jgi:hypothetical protein
MPSLHLLKRPPLWISLLFIAALLTPLATHKPIQAQSAWQASYWNNRTLSGEPVLQRLELDIDHEWGTGSPDPLVDADNFSARWTRTVTLPEGTYRFTITADDGMRVWIDDRNIIDVWEEGAARTVQRDVFLTEGTYEIRVEYYEATGLATAQYERTQLPEQVETPLPTPTPVPATFEYWRGEYYNNANLSGEPVLVRQDNNIDFDWGTGSPAPDLIAPETFSARWTRTLDLEPGLYRFAVTVDDGARLYVNDQLLIDQWQDQPPTTYTAQFDWEGGPLPVRLDYYENMDRATVTLTYAELLSTPTPTPVPAGTEVPPGDWLGQYFDNVNLSGEPVFVRLDDSITFDWGTGSPAPDLLGDDRFSVRWLRTVDLEPGRYRFIVTADDGVRLRVNGQLLLDEFTVQAAQSYNVDIQLPGGPTDIVMEYFENTGVALANLSFSRDAPFATDSTSVPDFIDDEVRDEVGDEAAAGAPDASGQPTATMTGASFLNVRQGPGAGFAAIDLLSRGQTVPLLGRNPPATWVEIQLPDGRTGWVNSSFMSSDYAYFNLPITS